MMSVCLSFFPRWSQSGIGPRVDESQGQKSTSKKPCVPETYAGEWITQNLIFFWSHLECYEACELIRELFKEQHKDPHHVLGIWAKDSQLFLLGQWSKKQTHKICQPWGFKPKPGITMVPKKKSTLKPLW